MSRRIDLIFARRRKRFLSADLVENRAELVKVYRLDQMKIESRLFAAPNVFVRAKPGDSHRFNRLLAFYLGNHLVAGAIGKANVAQHDIEFLRLHDFQSALRIIGDGNLVSEMSEQTRQGLSCVSVIFHEQNAQRLCRFLRSLRIHATFFDVVGYPVKCDLEGRAVTSPAALHVDRAAMKIDKMFRNRQAQAKPAKLTPHRRVSLLEWPEERSLPFDFNSDPVISDLKLKTTVIVVGAPDLDLSAGRGEFHGIVNEVPKHLLDSNRIGPDVILLCV